MQYLNRDYLAAIRPEDFQQQQPYPWLKIQKTLTDEGFRRLCENMPDLSLFHKEEGYKRAYGQAAHDRYGLHYTPDVRLPQPWAEFMAELQGAEYQSFLRRMLGTESFLLTFEWHYAWQGCSVSPHCDAARKIATHLFYFNQEDWDPAWGGQTLILDGGDASAPTRRRTSMSLRWQHLRILRAITACCSGGRRTPGTGCVR